MKKFFPPIYLLCSVFLILGFSYWYEQYWFSEYKEKSWKSSFSCTNQCYITLAQKWNVDYMNLQWSLNWNWTIAYWFTVWEQFALINQQNVFGVTQINEAINFSDYAQYFSSIPDNANLILLVNGSVKWDLNIDANVFTIWEKISQWWKQASQYYEYNPRTINFLEWPMRNWKYINQYFFKLIIILLVIWLVWYFFASKKWKRNALIYSICVLSFFRVFFSYFSTKNQIKIYKDAVDATNIMENWRVWKSSDFYQFLDFIKTKVPNWEKWYFIAPYPFDFEWKYHIYPNVKFDNITWVNYIFYYNPYWSDANTSLWFKEPKYSDNILSRDWNKLNISDVIDYTDYAKIYILKK